MHQLKLFDGSQVGMTADKTDDHSDLRTLRLTPREVELLLVHTYPFAELRKSRDVKGWHAVRIAVHSLELMIGDIMHAEEYFSREHCSELFEELEALCSRLQRALADRDVIE